MFPCFDQPDLKAIWDFSAATEEEWTVISNEYHVEDELRSAELDKAISCAQEFFGNSEAPPVLTPKRFTFH